MSVKVAAVVVSKLRVVLFENLGAEIDDLVLAALAVVVAAVLPLRSARGRHVGRVVLFVARPFGRAAQISLGGLGIRNAFDLWKRILAAGVFV